MNLSFSKIFLAGLCFASSLIGTRAIASCITFRDELYQCKNKVISVRVDPYAKDKLSYLNKKYELCPYKLKIFKSLPEIRQVENQTLEAFLKDPERSLDTPVVQKFLTGPGGTLVKNHELEDLDAEVLAEFVSGEVKKVNDRTSQRSVRIAKSAVDSHLAPFPSEFSFDIWFKNVGGFYNSFLRYKENEATEEVCPSIYNSADPTAINPLLDPPETVSAFSEPASPKRRKGIDGQVVQPRSMIAQPASLEPSSLQQAQINREHLECNQAPPMQHDLIQRSLLFRLLECITLASDQINNGLEFRKIELEEERRNIELLGSYHSPHLIHMSYDKQREYNRVAFERINRLTKDFEEALTYGFGSEFDRATLLFNESKSKLLWNIYTQLGGGAESVFSAGP